MIISPFLLEHVYYANIQVINNSPHNTSLHWVITDPESSLQTTSPTMFSLAPKQQKNISITFTSSDSPPTLKLHNSIMFSSTTVETQIPLSTNEVASFPVSLTQIKYMPIRLTVATSRE